MFDIHNNLLQSDNFSDIHKRYLDKRDKIKKTWTVEPLQSYVGDVLHGNIHRHGFYFVDNENKLFYDGLFYANKLEGYAQVFYNDGSDFQGLFKNNRRFGPGIFTYPDGEQDVGLWSGQRLLRLGSLNQANLVPRLAVTSSGQLKVLKFRYLVPICSKRNDIAYTILEELGASEEVLKKSYKLYNIEVQNKHNIFFNKKLFTKHFGMDQDCTIDIISNDEEENTDDDTEKEEQNEESAGGCSDINVERVREISEELEFIEGRLQLVKKQKVVMEEKVECCRICCTREQGGSEEKLIPSAEEEMAESRRRSSPIQMNMFAAIRADIATSNDSPILQTEPQEPCYLATEESAWSSYVDPPVRDSSDESLDLEEIDSVQSECFFEQSEPIHVVSRIQSYLLDTCTCDEVMHPRNLYEMEKELESLTRDVMFFESIKRNLKEKLEKHLEKCQRRTKVKTSKISVKDVLAWNNEDYCMRMLKHSFRHRGSEYMVNFKVSDLLAGNRNVFGHPGPHEKNCVDFLAACSKGDLKEIFKQVGKNEVDSNVCDSKGNNGIFFAAVNCHTEVIRTLVSLGTNLNQQNDEGLFPLSMCILVYIAEKYEVEDWEKSFLPDVEPMTEQKEAYKWYPNTSLLNLLQKYKGSKSKSDATLIRDRIPYLFDTPYIIPTDDDISKFKEQEFSFVRAKSKVVIQGKSIKDSIMTLLDCGADVNVCEAPLPPLILSVFTEDLTLVESILASTVNVDVAIKHDMTCLHIVASLKCSQINLDICSFLLAYNVNPKLKTSTDHWPEQKAYILGKGINPEDVVDCGKNALHIICMRRDFPIDTCCYFEKMAVIFSNSNIDFSDKYLGHTPLSLAVLVGNQKLVEAITKLSFINPYEMLDNNMGNILTIHILKRYEDVIPSNAKEILKCLVDLGVNPLRPFGEFDNAIEFMEKEHQVPKCMKKKSLEDRKPAENTGVSQKSLKEYLKELTRDTIIKYIQMQAVENLYNLVEDGLIELDCFTMLIEFLTPLSVMSNLQHLFRHGKIQYERYDKTICLKLIDMAKENEKEAKLKKDKKKSKTKVSKKNIQPPDRASIDAYDYNIILDMTDFKMLKRTDINLKLLPPGLDNISKYKVCFHCLKKRDKILLVCPRCQLVYFCSEVCNKANVKLRTMHVCNIVFYASESTRMESPDSSESRENLQEVYSRVRENCEKRLLKKREEQLEIERQKLEEKNKSDPYGLKQLSRDKRRKIYPKSPTITTLFSSTVDYAEMELDEYPNLKTQHTNESVANKTLTSVKSEADPSKKQVPKIADEQQCLVTQVRVNALTKPTTKSEKKYPCGEQICECELCMMQEKRPNKIKYKCILEKKDKLNREKIESKKGDDVLSEENVTVKKLRQIPSRYQEFVELLTRYFPEVDFSALFLPYACYSNGHLYYKFLDNDFYTRTYSMM